MIVSKNLHNFNKTIYKLILFLYMGFVFLRPTIQQYNTICVVLFFAWLFVAMLRPRLTMRLLSSREQCVLYLFAFFVLVTSLLNGTIVYTLKQVMFLILFFSPYLIYKRTLKEFNKEQLVKIIRFFLLFCFLMIIVACYFYATHYNAARRLAANINYYGNIAIGGGYDFAYAATILLVFLLGLPKQAKQKIFRKKVIYLVFIISLVALTVMTKSTITLLVMVFGCMLVWVKKRDRRGRYVLFTIALLVAFIILVFTQQIGQLLIEVFGESDSLYSMKLSGIGEFLQGSSDNTLAIRLNLMKTSFDTALTNPIIGVGYKYGYQSSQAYSYGVGGHSEIVDSLAKYGTLGSVLYFLIYYYIIKDNNKTIKKVSSTAYLFSLFLLASLNPLNQLQSSWTVLFIIPALSEIVSDSENIYKL